MSAGVSKKKNSLASTQKDSSKSKKESSWSSSDEEEDTPQGGNPDLFLATKIQGSDLDEHVLPRLQKLIVQTLEKLGSLKDQSSPLDFFRAEALYDFDKVSEWEMDLEALDDLIIIKNVKNDIPSIQEIMATPLTGQPPESKLATTSASNSSKSSQNDLSLDDVVRKASIASLTPAPLEQADRWASMDDDEDDAEYERLFGPSAHSKGNIDLAVTNATPKEDAGSHKEDLIQIKMEPELDEFSSTLHKFLEHASVYGKGWVTATRLKVRGRLHGVGEKARGQITVNLLDIGLVPENYIEKSK